MSRRRKKQIESPWADWPNTEYLPKEEAFHVKGKYRFKPGGVIGVLLFVTGVLTLFAQPPVGVAILALFVARMIIHKDRKINVKLARDAIEINGKAYARGEGLNEFSLEEHEKAYAEERSDRQGGFGGRVYREALQVVMWYNEKRIPIAEFTKKDVRKAQALLVRLQLLNAGLEKMLATAAGNFGQEAAQDEFGRSREIR